MKQLACAFMPSKHCLINHLAEWCSTLPKGRLESPSSVGLVNRYALPGPKRSPYFLVKEDVISFKEQMRKQKRLFSKTNENN